MKRKLTYGVITAALLFGLSLWWFSAPGSGIQPEAMAGIQGDASRGETTFHIGGCVSCHAQLDAEGARAEGEPAILSGGQRFQTPFGTFIAPNITPHVENGIGRWNIAQFANAMLHGISPDGRHYYPAFPYPSYTRMTLQDIVDLKAYMDTLPSHDRENEAHKLAFPFSVRRGLGLWKRLYLDNKPVLSFNNPDSTLLRGQYLVEGPGHCAECHTPRNFLGGFIKSRWLAGAANPDGDGNTPNITPHTSGIAQWDTADIAEYLSSGFTPEYDVVGGAMADVVENTAHLSEEDRVAIARYLQQVPIKEDSKGKE